MILRVIIIPFIIILFSFLFGTNLNHIKTIQVDSLISVKLSFAGDIMCHSPQMDYARVNADSFNFKSSFREVKSFFDEADLAFCNFETVTAGQKKKYTGYPLFNSPDELVEAIKYSGFDILFTSNNHALDRGIDGVERTIDVIKENNLIPIGTCKTLNDRDSLLIVVKKGMKIGLLAYTYGLNGNFLPKGKDYVVNLIDTVIIKKDIEKLRINKPDVILVYFHFGDEYSIEPSTYQKAIVERAILYGADLIIGSHSHTVQPIEYFHSKKNRIEKGLVAYSLGNFISNQRWRFSDAGVILKLSINKNVLKDSVWIDSVSIIPTWVYKGNTGEKKEFIVLPADILLLEKAPDYIKQNELSLMEQSLNDTKRMFFFNEHTQK